LEEKSGVSFSQISKIERGYTEMPSQETLTGLAQAFNVPYEILDRLARGLAPELQEPEGLPDSQVAELIQVALSVSPERRQEILNFAKWAQSQELSK
jgi:transcriptional regulator with XRE-family HTH domain